MNDNPLFPADPSQQPSDKQPDGYLLPRKEGRIEPPAREAERNAAADVIRKKLEKIYANEPDAAEEEAEVEAVTEVGTEVVKPRSKHQQFMHELANSGKSLADIQTEWHHYYITLPDDEKRQVWQEFYESNAAASQYHQTAPKSLAAPQTAPDTAKAASADTLSGLLAQKGVVVSEEPLQLLAVHPAPDKRKPRARRTALAVKKSIVKHVTANGKLKAKHQLQSLLFGLGTGALVIFIFLFGFFNEMFIAPFIQPSRNASATPLILSTDSISPTASPEVIIPKINVEIPVDYSETSTDESTIENDLEDGVVHYPTTVFPGQDGNAAFFGHSSNNIFNPGKYKFAFVLLHTLVPGDTFYLTYNGKVYVYKVISKTIVSPNDVGVLGPVPGQTATATLITCDPPGTSINRLVVVGQQVSPVVSSNSQSGTVASTVTVPATLPGNGPTLWSRLWHWVF